MRWYFISMKFSALKYYLSPLCGFCLNDREERYSWLCKACALRLDRVPSAVYEREFPPFASVRSAFFYQGLLREKILAYKYQNAVQLEGVFQELCEKSLGALPFLSKIDGIIPVPAHPLRGRHRGYNPPLRFIHRFARSRNFPLYWKEFDRLSTGGAQTGLAKSEREENVRDVFRIVPGIRRETFTHKTFLVVDDIWTTGTTLRTFSRFLKRELQVGDVYGFTLARTP